MKIQKYGDRYIAFGATWTTLPGANTQLVEVKKAAKEVKAKFYVSIVRAGSRPLFGFLSNTSGRTSNYSAAALITIMVPGLKNAIFSFNFEDGSAAIVCFVDGLPMVGFDLVGKSADIEVKIQEFLESLDEDADGVALYGNFSAFDSHFSEVQPFDFETQKIDEARALSAVFRRASIPNTVWIGLGFISLVSIATYFAYDWYQQDLLRAAKLKLIEPNIAYDGNVRRMLGEVGFPVNNALLAIIPSISQLPLYLGGWKLSSASCQIGGCRTFWVNDPAVPSTFSGFKSAIPEDWSANYKSDYQSIESDVKIKAEAKLGIEPNGLQSSDEFVVLMGTEVQRLKAIGIEMQFTKPVLFGIPQLPPEQPPITINVLKNPVLEGAWSISGPFWLTEYVQSMPPTMTLVTMTLLNTGKGITLKIEGKYYVKK